MHVKTGELWIDHSISVDLDRDHRYQTDADGFQHWITIEQKTQYCKE